MNRRLAVVICCLLPMLLTLAGCPSEEEETSSLPVVTPKKKKKTNSSSGTVATPSGLGGGIATGSANPSASPSASASAAPTASPSATASAAPISTPTPLVGVTSLSVTPMSVTLYLPPVNAQTSLGLPYVAQLNGYSVRSGQGNGGLSWSDRSEGQLTVSATGLVTVKSTATAGTYYVRASAIDDLNQYVDVPIEVRSTGGLDVTIQ